ncbi:D-glycero-beta-D-manno-heptose 1-phosphate adenylyltransferase [Streptomyces sp. WAC05374]|uniref:D-glycero-beta-D-manno-heptose 1-phosphate adenylyltransferase n=1 Tax=Streptomyces sp. WAC05374 TaxID=2487420 RepID=UPI000F86FC35|nr:D-glycero-beta-D-manno-heptose 1-phosphate adenylyltransferase [Streptomyces sp. WAC05374]RST19196.1 D-glycero-beta-D-manno-heptose 1-phosphate adenylyltransferase [Streptomyces sp. WAC05374]TDF50474.1 D-glycero-beta-D-manno-heptose 1-phosphate adenylyltransferase [Streptomyces sp. WAC05374]TDF51842.1 D-glycero-beta-D-manno-heptose 1-phosphate adenylyltransferase [Streptomyces sp. WAC05374]TDF60728.1 D-glycero-beta-D-manno-heptose 1-phosphate adenylyltransferase [Streptomyces sp. WAC05374]
MSAYKPLVVVGDVLLDEDIEGVSTRLTPDAPAPVVDVTGDQRRPGGAGLAAALATRGGRDVVLVTALGDDPASEAVRRSLRGRVRLVELPLNGTLPVKTRVLASGRPLVRIDRGGGDPGEPDGAVRDTLAQAHAVLVADYGRHTASAVRDHLAAVAPKVPVVWDPHLKGDAPVPGSRIVTPNAAETMALCRGDGDSLRAFAERGADLAERWRVAAVAVTLGERGVLLTRPGTTTPMLVPAPYRAEGDACGAGDCFAAATAAALADGALPEEAVQRAVAEAAAFVAAGGAGNPSLWRTPPPAGPREVPETDPFVLAEQVRARGGTVVATGGCFDLLHAGHVGLLESARRIGDCLIVCVNSDESVGRLKGPGRPLNPLPDRVRVLAGLGSVDAVAVFDGDTPAELLGRLRPDVWVKGGDYSAEDLPEAEVLRAWGGQAVVLPYLDGRSTTLLARRAAQAAAPIRPPGR